MKIKKILITGSTGFLGYQILEFLLKKGFHVTDLIRNKNKKLNLLKQKYKKNYNSILINKNFEKKMKGKKYELFIHLATFYKKKYDKFEISNLIESNINFPIKILKNIDLKKLTFVNFGSMMEYSGNLRSPKNIYATSKIFFEQSSELFQIKNQFNIKISETFSLYDTRKKIIPELIKSIKKRRVFNLIGKNLVLNFITIEIIFDVINKILNKKIKPGSYVLQNKKFTNISNLLKKLKNSKIYNFRYTIKKNRQKNLSLKFLNYNFDVYKKLKNYLNENS